MILDKHTPQPVGKGPYRRIGRCLPAMNFTCAASITCIIEEPETTQRSANRTPTVWEFFCLFVCFMKQKNHKGKRNKNQLNLHTLETVNRIGLKNRILKVFWGEGIVMFTVCLT